MTACVLFFSHQLSSLEAPSSSVSGPPVPSRSCSAPRCPSPLFQSHAAESTTLTKHGHPNTVTCADNHHKPARVMGSLSPRSGECSGTLVPTSDWRVEVPLTQSLCDTLCARQGHGSDGGQRRSRLHTDARRWELTKETVGPGQGGHDARVSALSGNFQAPLRMLPSKRVLLLNLGSLSSSVGCQHWALSTAKNTGFASKGLSHLSPSAI